MSDILVKKNKTDFICGLQSELSVLSVLFFLFCCFKLYLPFMWLVGWLDGIYCGCAMALRVSVYLFFIYSFCVRVCVWCVFFLFVSIFLLMVVFQCCIHNTLWIIECTIVVYYVLSFTLSISAALAKVEHYGTTIQVEITPVGITIAHLQCTQFNHYSIHAM